MILVGKVHVRDTGKGGVLVAEPHPLAIHFQVGSGAQGAPAKDGMDHRGVGTRLNGPSGPEGHGDPIAYVSVGIGVHVARGLGGEGAPGFQHLGVVPVIAGGQNDAVRSCELD